MPLNLQLDLLQNMEDRLSETITTGIKGVHERLDLLNGRTRASEVRLAEHGVRLGSLESTNAKDGGDNRRITKWDAGIVIGTATMTCMIVLGILKLTGKL